MQEWLSKYLLNHEDFKSELLLAFSTSSSEAVLPVIMKKMENLVHQKDVTSFVIPIGYSFNLDGSALYQSIAALFVAQMFDIHLSLTQQIVLMATLMIASKVWLACLVYLL